MKRSLPHLIAGFSSVVAVVAVIIAVYSYTQYRTTQRLVQNNTTQPQELSQIMKTLSVFMELPPDSEATLATVSDVSKLGANPFFSKAKNGDKVIIFTNAAKAILYRPSVKKVIEVAVFNNPTVDKVTNTSAASQSGDLVLTVLNGTTTTGITTQYIKDVLKQMPEIEIKNTGTANRRDYTDTMIIDISKKQSARVAELAKLLDISIGRLPSTETATGSDALIIVGSDKAK